MVDPLQRLQRLHEMWRQNPGRAPGGTGSTGLLSNDAQGWSDVLNQQTEAKNLENNLQGRGPVDYKQGHDLGGLPTSIADDPNSSFNTTGGPFGRFGTGMGGQSSALQGLQTAAMPEPNDRFMARTKARIYGVS